MLLWSLNRRTSEGKFMCDFTSQKVWIISWQILNIIGIIGLSVAIGKYPRVYTEDLNIQNITSLI